MSAAPPASFDESIDPSKKPWKFPPNTKVSSRDCSVVFRYDDNSTKVCHVPRKKIGERGLICVYRNTLNESEAGWYPLIARGNSRSAKPTKGPKKNLSSIEGKPGELLCTNDSDSTEDYCYIDSDNGLVPFLESVEAFGVSDIETSSSQLGLLTAFENFTGKDQSEQINNENVEQRVQGFCKELLESCIPDSSAGLPTPIIISAFIATNIASSNIDNTAFATINLGTAGGADVGQGALELVAVGWRIVVVSNEINKLLEKRKTNGSLTELEQGELGQKKKTLVDLMAARTPVMLYDSINAGIVIAAATNAGTHAYQATLNASSAFGSALGLVVNTYLLIRNSRQVYKSTKRKVNFNKAVNVLISHDVDGGYAIDPNTTNELVNLSLYADGKLNRRARRKGLMVGVSTVGVLGSGIGLVTGLATLSVITLANIWNPIGWALGSVAIAAGIGYTGYILYRRFTRKKRQEKARAKGQIATPSEFAQHLLSHYGGAYLEQAADPKDVAKQRLLADASNMISVFVKPKVLNEVNKTLDQIKPPATVNVDSLIPYVADIARHFN